MLPRLSFTAMEDIGLPNRQRSFLSLVISFGTSISPSARTSRVSKFWSLLMDFGKPLMNVPRKLRYFKWIKLPKFSGTSYNGAYPKSSTLNRMYFASKRLVKSLDDTSFVKIRIDRTYCDSSMDPLKPLEFLAIVKRRMIPLDSK
ncbi:hypothetical protein V8G54_032495 [Vigna mungo]|uniref:Uncharacterized protein n=1 Tax=Vigna mungo TaxID=3915 RepID=A0AAQ3MLJ0_VIGMU